MDVSACAKAMTASSFQGFFYRCEIDRTAPLALNDNGFTTTALYIFFHPGAEYTVNADYNLVTWLNQIGEAGFHTS